MPKRVVSDGSVLEVELPSGHRCLIDAEDKWILDTFPIWVYRGRYVSIERKIPSRWGLAREQIYLHRVIMDVPYNSKFQVDHLNRNKLDNRRKNLRLACPWQNSANSIRKKLSSTGYRGVTRITDRVLKKPFLVHIRGKNCGYFLTAKEAAARYNELATAIYGEFAILNPV